MNNKYELTDETKMVCGHILHRIKAIVDFAFVKKGEIGGWIETENNLYQYGNSWVSGDAEVYGNARVYGNAEVSGDAEVYGDAEVSGNAEVYGNARVSGNACVSDVHDYAVYKNTWSSGRWFTYTRSNGKWNVGCFYGDGDELIAKAYKDSELSGKCYESIVKAQEAIDKEIKKVR